MAYRPQIYQQSEAHCHWPRRVTRVVFGLALDASETAPLPLPPPTTRDQHSTFRSRRLCPHWHCYNSSHHRITRPTSPSLCRARRFGFGSARRHWLGPPASKPTRGFSTTPSSTYTTASTPRQLDHRSANPSPNLPPRLPLS
jgi:hypothetical protein